MTFDDNTDREALAKVLVELGVEELHSWRCQHPGVYGPCDCLSTFTDELAAVLPSLGWVKADDVATVLERRAGKEAPNAAEALRFMAGVIRDGRELSPLMLAPDTTKEPTP